MNSIITQAVKDGCLKKGCAWPVCDEGCGGPYFRLAAKSAARAVQRRALEIVRTAARVRNRSDVNANAVCAEIEAILEDGI